MVGEVSDPRGRALRALVSAGLLLASSGAAAQVVPIGEWTEALREDVRLGLEALPEGARAFPGGPLEIELHAEATPHDLGDATHPAFTHGLQRLHLYAFEPGDDRRAQWRLEKLPAQDQQRLWRRRAIVHAVIRRWDERLRWSARPGWQQLMGWTRGTALIAYPWAYSRRAGMESPALDLATFAEELLVPAESISPDAVTSDDRVRCRELSKARFLDERLTGLDAAWRPARHCPAFDRWADPEHVAGFEIGFAAPSTAGAQSLFGHLFLTIVRDREQSLDEQQALQLAALISPLEPRGFSYLARGLVGGYRGVFVLTTMTDVLHEANELEQRSVRRFKLELAAPQRLRMLERIWELERIGYVDYRFLNANCASMLRFLLAPAVGDFAPNAPFTPWETPAQVLEALGGVLEIPQLDEATGERARRVRAERRALVREASAQTRQALAEVWPMLERLDEASGADRSKVYAALGSSPEAWRGKVLLASLRIERHALDRASVQRIRAERSTVLPGWKGPTTDAIVEARQQRFEKDLSPKRRASDELGELVALDVSLRSAPRRPFEPWEQAAIEGEASARETFEAAASAVAALPEEALDVALEEERIELRKSQADGGGRTVPESGYGHAYVGVGLTASLAPVLRFQLALLREELGDQRQRGFGGRSELHVLEADLDVADSSVQRGSLIVIGGRAIGDSGWGWGARLDYRYAPATHEVSAELERLWAFLADDRLTNFLMASAALRAGLRVDPAANAAFYPRLGLSSRVQLPGSFGNALRFEAGYAPQLFVGSKVRFEHAVAGRVQLVVRIGSAVGFALSARAELEAEWTPGRTPVALGTVGFVVD